MRPVGCSGSFGDQEHRFELFSKKTLDAADTDDGSNDAGRTAGAAGNQARDTAAGAAERQPARLRAPFENDTAEIQVARPGKRPDSGENSAVRPVRSRPVAGGRKVRGVPG